MCTSPKRTLAATTVERACGPQAQLAVAENGHALAYCRRDDVIKSGSLGRRQEEEWERKREAGDVNQRGR